MPGVPPVSIEACEAGERRAAPRRSFAFPRARRLPSHSLFQKVFAGGGEIAGKALVVWVARGDGCGRRLGVVVTKKTFRDATDRNRAKRLIRESFRLLQEGFSGEPWDMVVLARRRILSMKQPDVQRELHCICRKLGIYGVGGQ